MHQDSNIRMRRYRRVSTTDVRSRSVALAASGVGTVGVARAGRCNTESEANADPRTASIRLSSGDCGLRGLGLPNDETRLTVLDLVPKA